MGLRETGLLLQKPKVEKVARPRQGTGRGRERATCGADRVVRAFSPGEKERTPQDLSAQEKALRA